MKSNISAFVYIHYIFYNTKNLILRILGLFLISYSAIMYVQLYSPYGFDSVNFFSKSVLPYTIGLTCSSIIVSIISILLYKIKTMWSCTSMRALTNIYISVLFLVASILRFDGNTLYSENLFLVITKLSLYIIIIPIDLFILIKWIVPKCSHKTDTFLSTFKLIFPVSGVVAFRAYLMSNKPYVNFSDFWSFIAFTFATITLINSIYYFTQAYFAEKHSLDILKDYTESYVKSLKRL